MAPINDRFNQKRHATEWFQEGLPGYIEVETLELKKLAKSMVSEAKVYSDILVYLEDCEPTV